MIEQLMAFGFPRDKCEAAVKRGNTIEACTNYLLGDVGNDLGERMFECSLCMDDEVSEAEIRTLSCDHRFCQPCLENFLNMQIREHKIQDDSLICPSKDCSEVIQSFEVKGVVKPDVYDKYLDLKLRKDYAQRKKLRECPKCPNMMDVEDEGMLDNLQCNACQHKFCGRCGEEWHRGPRSKDREMTCAE